MKLIDLLARELESWPELHDTLALSQDGSGKLNYLDEGINPEDAEHMPISWMSWPSITWSFFEDVVINKTADDYRTAIVTREQWQSARDKLKGETKVPKANKDGWIRHRGGKCPVADTTCIDYRMRNGETGINETVDGIDWTHNGVEWDIMSYRIHAPEQPLVNITRLDTVATWQMLDNPGEPNESLKAILALDAAMPAAKPIDGPLQWRDRIHTIDFDKAAAQQAHDAAMAALDSERTELVAKLKAEGLALISEPIKAEDSGQVDMVDWRNWKAGDIIECISDLGSGGYRMGHRYTVKLVRNDRCIVYTETDDKGSDSNGWHVKFFKFIHRP